jgi:hypothetical protein
MEAVGGLKLRFSLKGAAAAAAAAVPDGVEEAWLDEPAALAPPTHTPAQQPSAPSSPQQQIEEEEAAAYEPEPAEEFLVRPFRRALSPLSASHSPPAQDHAVWAKLRGYPAWPAQVLSGRSGHQAPPRPRPDAVLVHFFGTYDIQWLESDKKVSPFERDLALYGGKDKSSVFKKAVAEAQHFVRTGDARGGELPEGMTGLYVPGEAPEEGEPAPVSKKKGAKRAPEAEAPKPPEVPRRIKVARWLGLLPPADAHGIVAS